MLIINLFWTFLKVFPKQLLKLVNLDRKKFVHRKWKLLNLDKVTHKCENLI